MSENLHIAVRSLVAFAEGENREQMFDQAHDILDSLEPHLFRLRDLEALIGDIIDNPESKYSGPYPDSFTFERRMEAFQHLQQLVDQPLFAGKSFTKFDKFDMLVSRITRYIYISRLEEFIQKALGKLPDEIHPAELWPQVGLYHMLARLYGSSKLPSLAASFESKSEDEVLEQAKGVMKTLEPLLDAAKALALEHISRGEGTFYFGTVLDGFSILRGRAKHMALLQRYIHKSQRDGQAITKFMAGKFDRSAARLDCFLRAYILYYKDLLKEGKPSHRSARGALCPHRNRNLDGIYVQHERDDKALESLIEEFYEEEDRPEGEDLQLAVQGLRMFADFDGIRGRHVAASVLRRRTKRGRSKVLGADFNKKALVALHNLLRVDMETLERLNSDLKMLAGRPRPGKRCPGLFY